MAFRAGRVPRILFIDRSTKLKTIHDLETVARGGMVTSLFQVSDYLSQAGCRVEVLSDVTETGTTDAGTDWVALPEGRYDVLVANRGVGEGYLDIEAGARVLWTHDLPHSGFIPNPLTIRAFDVTVFMSAYAERIWRSFYKTIGRSVCIPNGIDRGLFFYEESEKDYDYLIYASAPNRGLQKLPFLFDGIAAALPGRHLYMNAYSNMRVLHPNEQDEYELDYKSFGESDVNLSDPLPQDEFAEQLRWAGLMILPSNYPEICSNTVLQSLASGTPVITTGNLGATPEWVRHEHSGMLTEWQTHDYMVYQLEVIRNATEVLKNYGRHRRMMRAASNSKIYSWSEVGHRWSRMLKRLC